MNSVGLLDLARNKAREELALRSASKQHLLPFIKYNMEEFEESAHHRLIASKLEAVERGEITRLMIFTPPRHTKSEMVSKKFPAWYIGRNPKKQIITASYAASLAQGFGRDVRNMILSRKFHNVFPGVDLSEDSSAKGHWHTNQGGVYVAVGVDGGLTGKGGNVCIIDDPVKDRKEAESPVVRQSTWDWYTSVLRTRLMPGAAIILVMTRWHPDDLSGRLIEAMHTGGEQWDVVNLPAVACSPDDPLGRDIGEALWPKWFPRPALDSIKSVIGEREWNSLYQQNPTEGGEFFSMSSLLVNDQPVPNPVAPKCVYAVIDTTHKGGSGKDGTAVSYFALQDLQIDGQYPLTLLDWDITEVQGGFLDTWIPHIYRRLEELSRATRARCGSIGTFVEDKAAGSILLQQAPRNRWQMQPICGKMTSAGKDARAINASVYINKGQVKISEFAFNKVSVFRGTSKNHWLAQMANYRVGQTEGKEDDLFDSGVYGIAIGLGNNNGV